MIERRTGIFEGIFWVVIGGIICALAFQYSLGSFRAPAPGFVAFLSGILVAGVGGVMILSKSISMGRAKGTSPDAGRGIAGVAFGRLAYTLMCLIVYAVLMEPLGYIVSTFLAMFGLFLDWEKRNWFWTFFFSVAASLLSYLVFEIWLRCQLPRGILPWW